MSRELFVRIMNAVEAHDDYFVRKRDAANVLGLSCFQKCTAAMRMLSYGIPADATDKYVRIGESTALESLRRFVTAVDEIFGEQYLRYPNEANTARLLAIGAEKGFPGMLGSIDCMHWAGKNCPYDKQGQYKGMWRSPLSFWRLLPRMTFGYGMLSLECLALTMTSMFFIGLLYLITWLKVELQKLTFQLMVMITQWVTILQMAYTPHGLL